MSYSKGYKVIVARLRGRSTSVSIRVLTGYGKTLIASTKKIAKKRMKRKSGRLFTAHV